MPSQRHALEPVPEERPQHERLAAVPGVERGAGLGGAHQAPAEHRGVLEDHARREGEGVLRAQRRRLTFF